MLAVLCATLFVSGVSALLFETLWFRQAHLALGNGFWASSIVLASYMAGLALGNGLAARFGQRPRRPLLTYAALELGIAVTGFALVWFLPVLVPWVSPLLGRLAASAWALHVARLALAFGLMVVPTTAMGATLPLLVRAAVARDPHFGAVLGRLYGWNTLGAVFGALIGEVALIEWWGIRGAALGAAGGNALAAAIALAVASRWGRAPRPEPEDTRAPSPPSGGGWLLIAAGLAGGLLLAFEVVWFRFLHLFAHSGHLAFAVMLAVVLAGIACGGLMAGAWLRRDPAAYRFAPLVALAGGAAGIGTYVAFTGVLGLVTTTYARSMAEVLRLSVGLMLPVALLSGVLFPLLGAALRSGGGSATRATGLLTLANTLGAAFGSLAAGFLLLPLLGMEASFFLLTVGYGLTALTVARSAAVRGLANTRTLFAGAALLAVALTVFPWGLMETRYLRIPVERWGEESDFRVVAVREGRTETAIYLERQRFGEPVEHSLLTDGFAMAGTSVIVRRYMKLFAIWPVAVAPEPKTALLISYGLGSTARALTSVSSLERIDVVDISRDILEMSSVAFLDPQADPLRDPRVRVHVEDGRHFLQTSFERWDVITGEPPPPKNAGIVSLYTRDYFQLVYDRLTEGGVNTYWLPVHNLLESDAKAIVKAYCEVFTDCSLWRGFLWDWILVGSRAARWPRSEAAFARPWEDPGLRAELIALGLERPEHLGATFIADADQLARVVEDVAPLVDEFPKRLSNELVGDSHWYSDFLRFGSEQKGRRARFASSDFIRRAWPSALRERTLARFGEEQRLYQALADAQGPIPWERFHGLLTRSDLEAPVLWSLGTDADEALAASRARAAGTETADVLRVAAAEALAARDYREASRHLERAVALDPQARRLRHLGLYASCMAGRACTEGGRPGSIHPRFWAWLEGKFPEGASSPARP